MPSLNTKLASAPNTTSNFVLRATSSTTIGNSTIQDDGTNVAIGTTPGTYKLNVSGTFNATGAATFSSSVTASGNGSFGGTTGADRLNIEKSGTTSYCAMRVIHNNSTADFYVGIGGSAVGNATLQNNAYLMNAGASGLALGTSDAVRMFITSGGNVGIGTSSPNYLLHVNSSTTAAHIQLSNSTTGSTTNDGARLFMSGLDVTLNNREAGFIAFETTDTERMRITSGGNVLIGTTTDIGNKLYINGSATFEGNIGMGNGYMFWGYDNQGIKLSRSGIGPKNALWALSTYLYLGYAESNGWERVYAQATSGGVYLTNGATSWTANSDERLKNINSNIENAVDKLSTLRTVNYSWKSDELNRKYLGLIAQDVQKVLPELVDKDEKDEIGTLGVRYTELIPVLVKAIQELKAEIDELKQIVATK
jgi:hypothetical protein